MKIRDGFVTNSSSTNFLVRINNYNIVKATDILDCLHDYDISWDYEFCSGEKIDDSNIDNIKLKILGLYNDKAKNLAKYTDEEFYKDVLDVCRIREVRPIDQWDSKLAKILTYMIEVESDPEMKFMLTTEEDMIELTENH